MKLISQNWNLSDQETFFQSSIAQCWWTRVNWSLSLSFLVDRYLVWSSAWRFGVLMQRCSSAYLCCIWVTAEFLSAQSSLAALTSDINKPENCYSLDIFCFHQDSLETVEMAVWENPGRSAVCEIFIPAHLAQTTTARSKSLKSPFYPHSDTVCPSALNCCHVIGCVSNKEARRKRIIRHFKLLWLIQCVFLNQHPQSCIVFFLCWSAAVTSLRDTKQTSCGCPQALNVTVQQDKPALRVSGCFQHCLQWRNYSHSLPAASK